MALKNLSHLGRLVIVVYREYEIKRERKKKRVRFGVFFCSNQRKARKSTDFSGKNFTYLFLLVSHTSRCAEKPYFPLEHPLHSASITRRSRAGIVLTSEK